MDANSATLLIINLTLGLFFILIGCSVTEQNAKYLLSGYNTMPEKDRNTVDITKYIPYFKEFHLWLGITTIVCGLIAVQLLGSTAGGLFIGLYPILVYVYLIWISPKYSGQARSKNDIFAIALLMAVLIYVGIVFFYEFRNID